MYSARRRRALQTAPALAAIAVFVLAGRPALAAPSPAARQLVDATLATLNAGRDPLTVHTLSGKGREILRDLVENDHPLTPPFYIAADHAIQRDEEFAKGLLLVHVEDPPASTTLMSDDRAVMTSSTSVRRVSAASPAWRLRDPITALLAARAAPDLRSEPDTFWHGARQQVVGFHAGRYPARILIDAATGLPSATEALVTFDDSSLPEAISWNALGDVTERTEFLNWSIADGLRYPLQQDTLRNGHLLRTVSFSEIKLDGPFDETALKLSPGEEPAHGSVQDYRPDQHVPGPYPDRPIEEIAPGVVQIPNSWYATIIRQPDGLVIIDAPISAGYAGGVLDEAARRYPGMRVKAVVTSTGFFWHVAGVREYAARGIPIYAHARNAPVIARMLAAPHTLAPDRLSRHPGLRPTIIPVFRRTTIGSGRNALELYPVAAATQPMLMTYLRSDRLLHTGEMVQPLGPGGSILFPESLVELIRTVKSDRLVVDRMIGMHMSPTPWTALADTLSKAHVTP